MSCNPKLEKFMEFIKELRELNLGQVSGEFCQAIHEIEGQLKIAISETDCEDA